MKYERFQVIADKVRPFAQYFYLHLWGEPMLNPDIIKIIRYASEFTTTNISTNGMSMTATKAEELITSGVSDIIISVDGVSQEVYEQYRVGGNVDKVLATLEMLQNLNPYPGKGFMVKYSEIQQSPVGS